MVMVIQGPILVTGPQYAYNTENVRLREKSVK